MANQRASDQVFIGIWVKASIAKKIEIERGGTPRSQWVRDAIGDILRSRGHKITVEEISAPSRTRTDLETKLPANSSKGEQVGRERTKHNAGIVQKANKVAGE